MIYKIIKAKSRAAARLLSAMVFFPAEEVVCWVGVEDALMVPFAVLVAIRVVLAGVARVVATAAGAEVASPVTKTAAALETPVVVAKTTWGTMTLVLMTMVLELDGMVLPAEIPVDSVQGTTTVVKT